MSEEVSTELVLNNNDVHDERMEVTRGIRARLTNRLDGLLDGMLPSLTELPESGPATVDIDGIDKIAKLLLKALGDTDKTELTLKRIAADKAMNEDNIRAAQLASESILRQLGKLDDHPMVSGNIIEGEVVHVTTASRDARLGMADIPGWNDTQFTPGMLIKGRVEENSDAFYERIDALSERAMGDGSKAAASEEE